MGSTRTKGKKEICTIDNVFYNRFNLGVWEKFTKPRCNMIAFYLCVLLMIGQAINNVSGERKDQFNWGTVTQGEYCDYEVFSAECKQGEMIVMESAVYGHMKIGRCVETDLGHLGCSRDVIDILDSKCTSKQRCNIQVNDRSLRETQPCLKGLDLFLEASYWCVPEQNNICSPIQAKPTDSYISSTQLYATTCQRSQSFTVETTTGQHIVLSLVVPDPQALPGSTYALASGDQSDDTLELQFDGVRSQEVGSMKSNRINIVLDDQLHSQRFLIGFRAEGCPDLNPSPPGTLFRRHGDVATVACRDTAQSWQLTCRGVRWIGVIGNCSVKAPLILESKAVVEEVEVTLGMPKDAIFLTIACATVFIAIVVITVGYVSLRKARLQQQNGQMPSNFNTVQRRSVLKQRPNSDYLTPAYPTDGQEAQDYEFPLREVPLNDTLPARGTVKRNNEEDYTASLSSNSTDYTRKYYVLDKDYIAVNNINNS